MGRPQAPVDLTKLVTLGDGPYLAPFAEAIVQLASVEGKKDVRRIVDFLGEFGYQAHNAREGLRAVGAFYRELQASGGVWAKLVYRPPRGEKTIKVPGQSPPVEEEAPKAS